MYITHVEAINCTPADLREYGITKNTSVTLDGTYVFNLQLPNTWNHEGMVNEIAFYDQSNHHCASLYYNEDRKRTFDLYLPKTGVTMSSNETTVKIDTSGMFTSLLLLIFITLKLTKVITWSWWWVMSPLWIPLLAVLVFLLVVSVTYTIKSALKK